MVDDPTPTHFVAPSLEEIAPHFPAYEMEHFIAQGGMGAVYQARQISLDRPVAIKILPREFGQDNAFRASFEAEAKAMAKLNHPNLISVYDFGEVEEMPFLVMEFVNGKSLYHSSHGRAIDPIQAGNIVSAICHGLDHAHTAGILHRDVKPANILLTPAALPKIGDFGLARPIDTSSNPDEIVYGTPGYTAPEVISGGQVDHRSDIFSTGVLLYELLTGTLPDANRTPPSLVSGSPKAFDNIIARAIHPSPDLRFSSANEMAEAIQEVTNTSSSITPKLVVTDSKPQVTTPAPSLAPKKSKTLPLLATLVGLAAVIAIVIAILPKFTGEPENPPRVASEPELPAPQPPAPTPPTPSPPEPEPIVATLPTHKPDNVIPIETPMQALARLKEKLASGSRDEFPPQTIKEGDNYYLLIKKRMSWKRAKKFAEEHGAHLAVLPDKQVRKKITASLGNTPAWLGAGMTARDMLQWTDGSAWNTSDVVEKSSDDPRVIAINEDGKLIACDQDYDHNSILQWRQDSSNPCTYKAQLERTRKSIESAGLQNAIFPVGTRTFGHSHYLLINESHSWEDAYLLAKSGKAHLAAPASTKEQEWLTQTYSKKQNLNIWIGGYLLNENSPWMWTNNEPFSPHSWKTGEPNTDTTHNRILMKVEKKSGTTSWLSSKGEAGETNHLLIEWNSVANKPAKTAQFDLEKWLKGVNRKIAARVEPIVKEYKEDREKEIDSYIRKMKREARKVDIPGGRRGPRGDRLKQHFEDLVDRAMDEVKASGEIANNIPEIAPGEFHKLNREARASLKELEEDYLKELKDQMEFYTNGLLKKATSLAKEGFTQQASELKQSVQELGTDTKKFTTALGL